MSSLTLYPLLTYAPVAGSDSFLPLCLLTVEISEIVVAQFGSSYLFEMVKKLL